MTTNQRWMITGGSRGLGRALTLGALDAGHAVVATARAGHSLPDHERLSVLELDVRDRRSVQDAVDAAASRLGGLDVVVNNAGVGLIGATEEVSEEATRLLIDTNLLGPLWLSQAAIPIMRAQGAGHIVQISSVGAVGTMPTFGLYNATKWGLEAFSEAMAAEVRRFGIRVSLIEPGALDTDWAGSSMRFAASMPENDDLRTELFGTAEVPWPAAGPTGGTSPEDAAAAILVWVRDPRDDRLRVLVGDDAPSQVRAALDLRYEDYSHDPRFAGD